MLLESVCGKLYNIFFKIVIYSLSEMTTNIGNMFATSASILLTLFEAAVLF